MLFYGVDVFRPIHLPNNRFHQLLLFCIRDYPVYFRAKPNIKRVLLFFILVAKIIRSGSDNEHSPADRNHPNQ